MKSNKSERRLWRTDASAAFREAQARVEQALETQRKELSFAGLRALSDLPPLEGLKSVEAMTLTHSSIRDLSVLNQLPNLRVLNLSWAMNVDWATIPPVVQNLRADNSDLVDLSSLNRLTNLRALRANSTKISTLADLNISALEELIISNTAISDISPLSQWKSLQVLSINRTQVSDLSPLVPHGNLKRLGCSQTEVSDLAPLRSLNQLTALNCFRTRISKLDPLEGSRSLGHLNVWRTNVRDLSPISQLDELRFLNLIYTHVSGISAISDLRKLRSLFLRFTHVTDISPLSDLLDLTFLDLSQTAVTDLSPLSALTKLKKLDISGAASTSLLPLANLVSLVDGAKLAPKNCGLFFMGCPLSDSHLRSLESRDNPDRTIEVIAYLRQLQGLPSLGESDLSDWEDIDFTEEDDSPEVDDDVDLPSTESVPEQLATALTFTSADHGPLDILEIYRASSDPEQAELYLRLRKQLSDLVEQVPSQERAQITSAIEDILNQPASWDDVRFKKVLWLCGNSLRIILSQHDALSKDPDPHYAKLPPAVGEALRRPVETWNIVVLGDPVLRELDARRVGPLEAQAASDQLAAAGPVISAATSDRTITTSEAASAIEASMSNAGTESNDIHARQAKQFASDTTQNLVLQILRAALKMAHDLSDPQSEEAKNFVKEYKGGIYKKLGEATVVASAVTTASAAAAVYYYGIPFLEFVFTQSPWLKAYLAITFENIRMSQMIDSINAIRAKILGLD